jgi:putative NADH-flavin reductase
MRILIIGASKGTGALAVKAALERGHEVTAFARSPERLGLEHPKLTKVRGTFTTTRTWREPFPVTTRSS